MLAALAALAASAAPAAPTGMVVWDGLLRAALAAGLVLLAARSRSVWWVPASVVAVVGAIGETPALAAARATLGAAVALAAAAGRAPVAGAVFGAVLSQVVLHLGWPERNGGPALLAALAVAPVALSGLRRSPRRQRKVMARTALALGALVLLGVAAGTVAGLLARPDLEEGASALDAGLAAARRTDQAASREELARAADRFGAARETVEATWALPARLVPVVGQHLAALQHVARAGGELGVTGAEAVNTAEIGSLRIEEGRIDLDRVRSLQAPLSSATRSLENARDELNAAAGPPWLLPPLADRLDRELTRISGTLAEVDLARQVAETLPGLLGGSGPRRYFLAIETPSEARGSGGIIGNYGEITTDGGKVDIGSFGRDTDLNTRGTPPEQRRLTGPGDYLARYARFQPERLWQNVTVAPDFPTVGQVIRELYPQSGGSPVDGVVTVDPVALASLLRVVGPVEVPPWPEPITADNAERILLFEQYGRLEGEARTDFLGEVAEAVADKITGGALPPPVELVRAMAPVVRGHHLLLYSATPAEQALFDRIGADGSLGPTTSSDSLAVVNVNAGGNKLDWFLRRTSEYRAVHDPGSGAVDATLTVTLRNEAPPSGLPDYVGGSSLAPGLVDPPDPPGANRTYLSAYSALALTGASVDGRPVAVEPGFEAGHNVYSLYLLIPPGATTTVVLRLTGAVDADRGYHLDLRAQPLTTPELFGVEVVAGDEGLVTRAPLPLAADERLPRARR